MKRTLTIWLVLLPRALFFTALCLVGDWAQENLMRLADSTDALALEHFNAMQQNQKEQS